MSLNNITRSDLSIEYHHVPVPVNKYKSSSQGFINQSMPMAAIFMRNKFLGWLGLLTTWHSILTVEQDESSDQGPIIQLGMSIMSLFVCYINLIFPQSKPVLNVDSEK